MNKHFLYYPTSLNTIINISPRNPVKTVEVVSNMSETNYQPIDITSIILMNTRTSSRSNCWIYSDEFSYPSTKAKSRWKKTDAVNIPFRY